MLHIVENDKKDLIEPKVGKLISSYHLKTCLFYVLENTRCSFWKRKNLTQCMMVCLCALMKWVYLGYCRNYFIKEENMFEREIHRTQRLTLLQHLHYLLCHGIDILFHIKLDQVGVFLRNGATRVQTDLKLIKVRFFEKVQIINVTMLFKKKSMLQGQRT